MKKLFIGCLMMVCIKITTNAQSPAKAVFFELGGPGVASLNYDMRFTKSEKGFGGRVGVGGFSVGSENERGTVIFLPVAVNYITSKDDRNYFEIGAGITPVILKETFSNDEENFRSSFGHFNIGYRLQPQNGGFFFRAAITPVFGKNFFWPYYAGISLGYKF